MPEPVTVRSPGNPDEEVSGVRSGALPVFKRRELVFERLSCCDFGRAYLFRVGTVVRMRVLPPDADYEAWPSVMCCPFCGGLT
jgi:hypothetical protein